MSNVHCILKGFTPPFDATCCLANNIGVAGCNGERRQCPPEAGGRPAALPGV